MKKLMLLLFSFIMLIGCDNATNDSEPVTNNVTQENEPEAELEEEVEELPPELTIEEAQEIVSGHFLIRLIDMRNLMDDVHTRDDYQLYYDNSTEEYTALEQEIEALFTPYVIEDKVQALAVIFAEINTCECDSFSIITPNMANVNFTILEQNADEFVASFIELGEVYNPTHGTHTVTFVNEADTWKFSESEFKEHSDEVFNLDKTEIANYGFDYATNEVVPMKFIENRTVDGKELIVMEDRGTYAGYDIQSGEMHVLYDY